MIIFIKTLTNKYKLIVHPENTITYLRYQIEKILDVKYDQQRLIFNGAPMVNERTLEESGVKDKSMIFLVLCMF
jgi:hypothetical protein